MFILEVAAGGFFGLWFLYTVLEIIFHPPMTYARIAGGCAIVTLIAIAIARDQNGYEFIYAYLIAGTVLCAGLMFFKSREKSKLARATKEPS